MILNFLKKIRSELLEEKLKLEEKQNEVQLKLDEKALLIQKLKAEEERSFDAFSPRRQNVELRDNIFHLEEDQQGIVDFSEQIKDKLKELNSRLDEVNLILEDVKQQRIDLARLHSEQAKQQDLNRIDNRYADFDENLVSIYHKAEFCLKLVEVDPIRCKLELSSMVKELKTMVGSCIKNGENENETYDSR